jgi:hypothetical protein
MHCRDDISDGRCGQRARSVWRRFDVVTSRQIIQDCQFGIVNGFNAAIHRTVNTKSDSGRNKSRDQHHAKTRQVSQPSHRLSRL